MSDNVVVQFPTNPERELRIAEAQIKKALVEQNFPSEAQKRLLIRLRPFCETLLHPITDFAFSIDFHGHIPKPQADAMCAGLGKQISQIFADQIRDLLSRVVAERTDREIQDCRDAGLL